jgi:transglutaminase-like putative cysteine protease
MMQRTFILILLVLWTAAVPAGAEDLPKPLRNVPLGDTWFFISMDGENKGFARQTISETPDGYEIAAEGSVKITVMGFSREASSRESYRVRRDLSLRAFSVDETLDGSTLHVSGEATAKGVRTVVETAGTRKEKFLKTKGAVYPMAAVNLYPLLQGGVPGKEYRVPVLDPEDVKIREVKVTVVERTTGADGVETIHLRNNLHSPVDNDVWVDGAGRTLRETVRDGLVDTTATDAETVRRFMLDAAVSKKDLILDFSLVKVDPPIKNPGSLKRLTVELSGIPADTLLPAGAGQRVVREGDSIRVTVEPATACDLPDSPLSPGEVAPWLAATDRILADQSEIIREKDAILKEETEPVKQVRLLVDWVARNIEDTVYDSQSPLEVLSSRSGNCQSHARLYASLARAAGIPTRFVSGLVYVEGKGFLYHSWAESYVGFWQAVDPTFNQVPADATHIALAVGDTPGEMAPVAALVGRVRARVIETVY